MTRRKFRVWDSQQIQNCLEVCLQIQTKVEQAIGEQLIPEDLPNSVIPSSTLYDIAATYVAMYEKLMVEDLIQSSNNPKLNRKIH